MILSENDLAMERRFVRDNNNTSTNDQQLNSKNKIPTLFKWPLIEM